MKKNDEIATKQDIKDLRTLLILSLTVVVGIISAGFGYLINAINNNHDLLNTIIGNAFK
jgi:hypothetical protein